MLVEILIHANELHCL